MEKVLKSSASSKSIRGKGCDDWQLQIFGYVSLKCSPVYQHSLTVVKKEAIASISAQYILKIGNQMRLRGYQSRKHCSERSEARLLLKRYICEQSLGSSCV